MAPGKRKIDIIDLTNSSDNEEHLFTPPRRNKFTKPNVPPASGVKWACASSPKSVFIVVFVRVFKGCGAKSTRGPHPFVSQVAGRSREPSSGFGFAVASNQRNGSLRGQQQEGKGLLQVKPDRLVVMA